MKDEINNYGIKNADGQSPAYSNLGKVRFSNDNPRAVKESSAVANEESFRTTETFNDPKKSSRNVRSTARETESVSNSGGENVGTESVDSISSASSASSAATSAASTAASGAAASSAAIGSSIGAIAGTVASAVVTAAIVVAVFVSTMSINLSLVMANMDSLVLQIEMQGAQEEDFENPIIAILEGEDGSRQEQEISPDTVYLTFEGLAPGKEYLVSIKNQEKVFVSKSFITATKKIDRGSITAHDEGNRIYGSVANVQLRSDEFYTITAKDVGGNVLFTKDSIDRDMDFSFDVSGPTNVLLSLSVNGVVYAAAEVEMVKPAGGPQYDLDHATWVWTEKTSKISFADLSGGDPLLLDATVTLAGTKAATCDQPGTETYSAVVSYEGKQYADTKEFVVAEKLGHAYNDHHFVWQKTQDGYIAKLRFVCANDDTHYLEYDAVVNPERIEPECEADGKVIYYASVEDPSWEEPYYDEKVVVDQGSALGHDYGELVPELSATTTETGMKAHYVCSRCQKLFDVEYQEVAESDLIIAVCQPEYDYTNPIWHWEMDGDIPTENATVSFAEIHGGEPIVYEASVVRYLSSSATCESPAVYYYHADTSSLTLPGVDDIYENDSETFEEGEPLGHDYGESEPEWNWTEAGDGYVATASFPCQRCVHVEELIAQVTQDGDRYYATVVLDGQEYHDEYEDSGTTEYGIGDGNVSFNNSSRINLYADGYEDGSGFHYFESTADNRICITGSQEGDMPLMIYSNPYNETRSGSKVTYYLTFDNVDITASSWAAALVILPYDDMDIYIENIGNSHIAGYNHPAFSIQGESGHTVNIHVTSENGFDSFVCGRQDGDSPTLYNDDYGGSVTFTMNGTECDSYGNSY